LASQAAVDLVDVDEKSGFKFDLKIETLPTIKAVDLSAIKAAYPDFDTPADKLEEVRNRLRRHFMTQKDLESERPAKLGDVVIIDFHGETEDGPIQGGSGEDVSLELGSNTFIPGFEDQLVGMNVGDEKTIEVTFPDNYGTEKLAGKKAKFDITVHKIQEVVFPEITEELAKQAGADSLEELNKVFEEAARKELANKALLMAKRSLFDTLNKMDVLLPASLVAKELESIQKELAKEHDHDHNTCGHDHSKDKDFMSDDEIQTLAQRRVRLGLLVGAIGEQESVTITREDFQQAVLDHIAQYPAQIRGYFLENFQQNPENFNFLRPRVFEDKVVRAILEKANVDRSKMSAEQLNKTFDDMMSEEE
jgi:trigger factor